MLFDLRSRGRRHTVRVIYLFLALVMAGGLILVGVGTGSNQGGLLNAFTNNGSGGGGGSAFADQQLKSALKATKKSPHSASAWASLMSARWSAAGSGTNYNTTTSTYTKSGKQQLQYGADAWQRYLSVTGDKPSYGNSFLGAAILQNAGQWSNAASAWEYAVQTSPAGGTLKPYLCLALSSYAAGDKSKGDLAAAKAVKLTPKLQRLTQQSDLKQASTSTSVAQATLVSNC